MSRNRRLVVAALTVIALFSVIVLAAGLSALQVGEERSPQVLRRETPAGAPEASPPETAVEARTETLTERGLVPIVILTVALAIVVIFMVVTAEGRKLLVYTLLMLLLLLFVILMRERPASGPTNPTPVQDSAATPVSAAPPLAFEPPPWLILGASLGAALLLVGAITLAGLRLARQRRPPTHFGPLPELAEEARQALADLQAGLDLRNVIIRCYRDMSDTLQQHRGFRRAAAMTPEEFARTLAATNLPQADVWRITRLFERVRYGQHMPDAAEEAEAVACLTTIARACVDTDIGHQYTDGSPPRPRESTGDSLG